MHILAENACVDFKIHDASSISLKNIVVRKVGGLVNREEHGRATIVRALDNISFELKDGDRVALLGHNGSGKTTLLRMLAGIYRPTQGRLQVTGRTVPLFDLSLGLDPDATGYENIHLRGLYFGMSRREMESRVEAIASFSELGPYLHLPVRTYSSGMTLRLLFSVAVSIDADILLLDEWLAVGDANFISRAHQKLRSVVDRSRILAFASHSPALQQEVCNKALLLEAGRVVEFGEIDDVLFSYYRRSQAELGKAVDPRLPNFYKARRVAGRVGLPAPQGGDIDAGVMAQVADWPLDAMAAANGAPMAAQDDLPAAGHRRRTTRPHARSRPRARTGSNA